MKNVIIVIQGGLGNQLWQWAFAHTISGVNSFQLDTLRGLGSTSIREFELLPVADNCSHFRGDIASSLVSRQIIWFFHILDRLWQIRIFRRAIERLGYLREDPRFNEDQTTITPRTIRYAKGYFQKQQNIEKNLSFVQCEIIPVVKDIFPNIREKFALWGDYSVLHVRRGDYESTEYSPKIIGTLSDEYFIKGIASFNPDKLVILSENRRDVIDLIKFLSPDLVLDSKDTSPWETLAIMYGASNMLGSNSSLSWWGARICALRGGNVWLPSQWSSWGNINSMDYHFPSCNIIESHWKQGNNRL